MRECRRRTKLMLRQILSPELHHNICGPVFVSMGTRSTWRTLNLDSERCGVYLASVRSPPRLQNTRVHEFVELCFLYPVVPVVVA